MKIFTNNTRIVQQLAVSVSKTITKCMHYKQEYRYNIKGCRIKLPSSKRKMKMKVETYFKLRKDANSL